MKICGLQKLTLIDYPGKVACTLFFYGCNFRCGFCHNPELVVKAPEKIYSEEEILDFLEKRKNYLDGVCITGGEPLMTLNLDFLKKIKNLGYSIKIDTNGSYPEKLKEIIEFNLVDYIAMDIKSSTEKYDFVTNVSVRMNLIEESIKMISKFYNHEFRTTIVERHHDLEEVEKIARWVSGLGGKKFVLQGFKNSGKLIGSDFKNEKDCSNEKLNEFRNVLKNYFDEVIVRA